MKKKKKNGFTLIELLAILVILAIIAVITVPIILSIIESSKKGAAIDSAYGYADGIEKFLVSKVSEDINYNIPDGTYYVDNTNGYLIGTGDLASINPLEVKISGTIPTSGTVEMEENEIKIACLQFGEYKVSIENGIVGDATQGVCAGGNQAPSQDPTPTSAPTNVITSNPIPSTAEECGSGSLVRIDHTNGDVDFRFMGADPCNYIYFNCPSYELNQQNSTNCEKWRIIGVFNNKLKIVRDELSTKMMFYEIQYVADYNLAPNDWNQSDLKTYLNGTYYNSLTAATKTKIANSTWYLGGLGNPDPSKVGRQFEGFYETGDAHDSEAEYKGNGLFPETAYLGERGTTTYYNANCPQEDEYYQNDYCYGLTEYQTTTTANIGLIYPSDYGFASSGCYSMCAATESPESCSKTAGTYNISSSVGSNPRLYSDNTCKNTNWLDTNYDYWTITHFAREEDASCRGIYTVNSYGYVWGMCERIDYEYGVRPTLYLNSNIELEGTGAQNDPYKIKP